MNRIKGLEIDLDTPSHFSLDVGWFDNKKRFHRTKIEVVRLVKDADGELALRVNGRDLRIFEGSGDGHQTYGSSPGR